VQQTGGQTAARKTRAWQEKGHLVLSEPAGGSSASPTVQAEVDSREFQVVLADL
jgi:hypothetical protein